MKLAAEQGRLGIADKADSHPAGVRLVIAFAFVARLNERNCSRSDNTQPHDAAGCIQDEPHGPGDCEVRLQPKFVLEQYDIHIHHIARKIGPAPASIRCLEQRKDTSTERSNAEPEQNVAGTRSLTHSHFYATSWTPTLVKGAANP